MTKRLISKRISLILTFIFIIFCSRAQENKITINLQNSSLKEVLNTIEKQTEYRFSYRNSTLNQDKNISIAQVNVPDRKSVV